ncbi:MipA/OmpV family protein [Rhizobium sp. KVB221]|uniref:MipA/OmpV family protein n=2 Tax=Rhizobium setariae TaxID=2801340 RepID=A0A937CJ62_9HYPH|nr:MipA/OmpV family protein [Rhizobium setariae]MBL0370775.1 MipA/OmpV family protein [Rhizobium setariae]
MLAAPSIASAGDYWWSGDWYLKVGASGFMAPRYEGSKSYLLQGKPMISLGKAGDVVRFTSRNDNASFSLYDAGFVRLGAVGKLDMPRDADDSSDLKGLKPVKLGVEVGGFAEVYPTDWLRMRAEVRQGIRSHQGIVADLAADAFYDVTPVVRVSAGPRVSFASADYVDAYYGVNASESAKSGLSKYKAKGGIQSAGVGAAINWQATENIDTSAFGEYKRLLGPVGDSSLVQERGSKDQYLVGVSATYRFNFTLP